MSDFRATRPLNPDAVRAADAAVAPETGGRRLTTGPEDADLRRKWMEAYQAAGGQVEESGNGKPQADPQQPVQPCANKPLETLEIVSVHFLSDHGLLKDEELAWTNTGSLYPRPEWVAGRESQTPMSHTMGKPVKAKVKVKAGPPGACPEAGTLEGAGPAGLNFSAKATFRPGVQEIAVTSDSKLDEDVQKIDFSIAWTATSKSASGSATSQNDLFVTIARPVNEGRQEDGVTMRRMQSAVDLVSATGSTDPHTIVAALMKLLPYYTLRRDPAVPAEYSHPTYFNDVGGAWPIADYLGKYAECQAIVRFVRAVIKQVGCPGEAKTVVIWADPDVEGGKKALEREIGKHGGLADKKKKVGGKTWYAALADRDPVDVGRLFTADTMGLNNFEACLRFSHGGTTKYYGGGAGAFDSPQEVITAFYALVWVSFEHDAAGDEQYRIEEIVERYR